MKMPTDIDPGGAKIIWQNDYFSICVRCVDFFKIDHHDLYYSKTLQTCGICSLFCRNGAYIAAKYNLRHILNGVK